MSDFDRNVIAYAFLAQAKRDTGDLLSGLMPIFKPIAKLNEGKRFDPGEFSRQVRELFGMTINTWAVEALIPRLESAGVIVGLDADRRTKEYLYAQIDEDFTEVHPNDIELLLDSFVEFSKPILKNLNLEDHLDDDTLRETFIHHMLDFDFIGVVLKPREPAANDSTLTLKKSNEESEWKEDKKQRARFEILSAAFITHLYHNNSALYELAVRVVTGAMLTEVILNFQEPESGISLEKLTVILDAPFLMSFLDLTDAEWHETAGAIVEQLQRNGAVIGVFGHSIEELQDNLSGVMASFDASQGFGPTARRLFSPTFREYAESIRRNPEAAIERHGIELVNAPNHDRAYRYFTEQQEEKLFATLGYYEHRLAQERDTQSIAAVIRLRRNRWVTKNRFQDSNFVFLTSNPWLSKRSHRLCIEEELCNARSFPAVMRDRECAALLWVLYGGSDSDIPHHVLLANCAGAIEPGRDTIERMHGFLNRLSDAQADHFRAMMTDQRASQYFTQLTLGDATLISENNYEQILSDTRKALIEEERRSHREEIGNLRDEHERKEREHVNQIAQITDEVKAVQVLMEKSRRRGLQLEQDRDAERCAARSILTQRLNRYLIIARRFGLALHWVLAITIALIGTLAALILTVGAPLRLKVLAICMTFIVILLSSHKVSQWTLGNLFMKFQRWTFSRLERRVEGELKERFCWKVDWDIHSISVNDVNDGHQKSESAAE